MKLFAYGIALFFSLGAQCAQIIKGKYVNFSQNIISSLTVDGFGDKYLVKGLLQYGTKHFNFDGLLLNRIVEEENAYSSSDGTLEVRYSNGAVCVFNIGIIIYVNPDDSLSVRLHAPANIEGSYSRNACRSNATTNKWYTITDPYQKHVQNRFVKTEINKIVPDRNLQGVIESFQVEELTKGNNYDRLFVDIYMDHPHMNDLWAEFITPEGETIRTGRLYILQNKARFYTNPVNRASFKGEWKVKVYDKYKGSEGVLNHLDFEIK